MNKTFYMRIKVKVKPNARENSIKEIEKDYFEIKVSVPPEKGKANEKVIDLMSKYFKVPKSKIQILTGHSTREKVVHID
jgi:uncharacterized protein (TIGR00251 family)